MLTRCPVSKAPGLLAASALLVAVCGLRAQQPDFAGVPLRTIPVQGNVYMLVGAGGNMAVQVGSDGVLVVDTMYAPLAPRIAAEIKKIAPGPIRFIIDTSLDADHTGGNAALSKMGVPGASPTENGGATIIAQSNVLNRMSGKVPRDSLPNDEYFMPTKDFFFNNEPVFVVHEANAHTDGDSIVLFRRSDVISTGDIFTPDRYPVIDIEHGGSVRGLVDALNHILLLTVPAKLQEGGTRVIPGHGRLCDEADVVEYRNMITIVRDRVLDMVKKGMTLDQVKAARPTFDYDSQYGSGDAFTEAVYRSLSKPDPKPAIAKYQGVL